MTEVALLGAAHIHTPAFVKKLTERQDVKVKYVWDHDRPRAEKNAAALGAAVSDLDTILADSAVRAAIVCSETDRHEDLVLAAVRGGRHVFVEKPLGLGKADAFRMAKAIEKAGVIFQTGYMRRGDPVHLFLKEQIAKGHFGRITRVRVSVCHAGSLKGWFDTDWRWMADPAQAGVGAFGDLGTHGLDALLWWFGEVTACTGQLSVVTIRYGNCDETGEALIRFRSGVIATLAAAWVDVADPVTIQISGTEGQAALINGQLFYQSFKVEGADGKRPWTQLPAALPHAFDLFLDALGGKTGLPLVPVREAAYACQVMEAIYKGAQGNRWVEVR